VWILGIDPGLNGACSITDGKTVRLFSIPTFKSTRGREVNWSECAAFIDMLPEPDHCFIERVSAMPTDSRSGAFKFGYIAGGLRGIIAAKRIPVTLVTPSVWKKKMGLIGKDKDASRQRATELFPEASAMFARKKDDGRAEATLIALYGLGIMERR
jgi:crossover junction endodeoxyribonuclease RuvC